ncbi:MAG TPA: rhodanese-like domain-containing protein, partial [Gammaproteobacteria bacterium]|nr:rhodanese-like domain-containing protein [Gammaproteobacteria bacterium]
RVVLLDALEARTREFTLARDPECALCGSNPSVTGVAAVVQTPAPALPEDLPELAAANLDAWLEADPRALVLDVREPHEAVLGAAPRSVRLPASQLEARMHELDTATPYVIACRVGVKSAWAARRLWDAGFRRLHHLEGGLLAYAAQAAAFDAF